MTCESLLSNISMVFQNVYLFHDTIRANICFGKTDATEEEMTDAAKKACCHDFIMALPDGYDTVIGEGGGTLSGGEKQRISIAHRLATIEQADRILVVDDGRIVHKGTHKELISVEGRYREFIQIREKAEGWKI